MRNILLLLASTVTLTLSRAAHISERSCQNWGNINVAYSNTYTVFDDVLGKLAIATTGHGFTISTSLLKRDVAYFYFNGCAGGEPFHLYCTNCGSTSGLDVLATNNRGYDIHGEPDDWFVLNKRSASSLDQPIPDREVGGSDPYNITSYLWEWDLDGSFIRPVTYNRDWNVQPLMYAVPTGSNVPQYYNYEFTSTAKQAHPVYALWWQKD